MLSHFTDTCEECGVAARGLKYSSSLNYRNSGNLSWTDGFSTFKDFLCEQDIIWVHFKSTETQQISCAPTQYGNEHSSGSGDEPVGLRSHFCSSERSSTSPNARHTLCPMPGDFAEVKVHISLEGWMISGLGTKPCCTNILTLIVQPIIQSNPDRARHRVTRPEDVLRCCSASVAPGFSWKQTEGLFWVEQFACWVHNQS